MKRKNLFVFNLSVVTQSLKVGIKLGTYSVPTEVNFKTVLLSSNI